MTKPKSPTPESRCMWPTCDRVAHHMGTHRMAFCLRHQSDLPPAVLLRSQAGPLSSPCWVWTGCIHSEGYGLITKDVYAHRWFWEQRHGQIPPGVWVLHRCDNPPCCADDHHFLGDRSANVRDAVAKHRHRGPWKQVSAEIEQAVVRASQAGASGQAIARRFGIGASTVHRVLRRCRAG